MGWGLREGARGTMKIKTKIIKFLGRKPKDRKEYQWAWHKMKQYERNR